jgi:long-chain acyl-CoA synthetase
MGLRTVYQVLEETAAQYGNKSALYQPTSGRGSHKYQVYGWIEYRDAVREIACGLRRLGVSKGEIVGLHSETRAEFYLADIGVMTAGAVAAALYTSYPAADLAESIRYCGARVVFVEDPRALEMLQAASGESLPVRWILLTGKEGGTLTLAEVRELGREALRTAPHLFDQIQAEYSPHDPAILYTTSGATGSPKMGLVSHLALTSNLDMGPAVIDIGPDDVTIAFLPSAHIAQRLAVELLPIRLASPVWFSEGLSKLPNEIKTLRPTWFLAPPRLWERVYVTICTEIRKRPLVQRKLFYGALGLGLEAARLKQDGKPLPGWLARLVRLADRVVFRKIRERFGGRLRVPASGAAPLGKELARFYAAIGMPLIEGYGLTEGGIVIFNPLSRPKAGSIGKPLPGIEVKIAEDGELLISSSTLFDGYFRDPEATAGVLRDGWLFTGDIAEVDAEGYLYITGRKKELIVSSNGKKIYPARIESLLKSEPLINQVLLIGDRMPYVTALLTLNSAAAEVLKGMEKFQGASAAELAAAEPVQQEIRKAVARVNRHLAPFEQVRRFRVVPRDFSLEDGELTPTMKVRRQRALENFRSLIQELYAGKEDLPA